MLNTDDRSPRWLSLPPMRSWTQRASVELGPGACKSPPSPVPASESVDKAEGEGEGGRPLTQFTERKTGLPWMFPPPIIAAWLAPAPGRCPPPDFDSPPPAAVTGSLLAGPSPSPTSSSQLAPSLSNEHRSADDTDPRRGVLGIGTTISGCCFRRNAVMRRSSSSSSQHVSLASERRPLPLLAWLIEVLAVLGRLKAPDP